MRYAIFVILAAIASMLNLEYAIHKKKRNESSTLYLILAGWCMAWTVWGILRMVGLLGPK